VAIRPALATLRGRLLVASSLHRRAGLMYDMHRKHFGRPHEPTHLYLQGASVLLNPTLDKSLIEADYQDDAESARAEWGGEFRSDISAYLSDDVIERALCPVSARGCGSMRSATSIHRRRRGGARSDDLRGCAPGRARPRLRRSARRDRSPFDTEAAVERCAMALKSYGVTTAQADKYAASGPPSPSSATGSRSSRASSASPRSTVRPPRSSCRAWSRSSTMRASRWSSAVSSDAKSGRPRRCDRPRARPWLS